MAKSAVSWFEIPAVQFERAVTFYETVFALPKGSMHRMKMQNGQMAMFPCDEGGIGGAIWHDGETKPAADGTKVYLNANGVLDDVLKRVPAAGGKVICDKMAIGEWGHIGLLIDTEGNLVGLHSM
jgi:predicted enzyme related to lactoylglutathione lyase